MLRGLGFKGIAHRPVTHAMCLQFKDAILASKLDAISWEYNHLLTSQLDSQRQYFEAKLVEAEAAAERRAAAAAAEAAKAAEGEKAAAAEAREADRRRQQLEKKLVSFGGLGGGFGGWGVGVTGRQGGGAFLGRSW